MDKTILKLSIEKLEQLEELRKHRVYLKSDAIEVARVSFDTRNSQAERQEFRRCTLDSSKADKKNVIGGFTSRIMKVMLRDEIDCAIEEVSVWLTENGIEFEA